jgi:DNA-binding NarL/FixJ family response regulator
VPDRGAFRYPLLAGTLTRRESQVLLQLRDPLSIKEIARRQGLSYATVKRHSINIYSKLGVNNRWDAVALAIELGLIPER